MVDTSVLTLVVMAKAPVAGRSKTRLCPPCTPAQAAQIAEAALIDTLDTVAATPAGRRVVALDGRPGPWLPDGVDVIAQRGDGLGERLAAVFEDVDGPLLLVGMDTPQVTPDDLASAARLLADPATDAVLGHAPDGGWWAIGMDRPDPAAFDGVPMSTADTGACQQAQLEAMGLRVALLAPLRDVDRWDDATAVARARPDGAFAGAVAAVGAAL